MIVVRLIALVSAVAISTASQAARLTLTTEARALQPGELVLLTVATPAPAEKITVRAFGRDVPASRDSSQIWRVLIGIDLDTKPGAHSIEVEATLADGSALRASKGLTVLAKKFTVRRLTVDPDFVNPPPEAAERIEQERKELDAIWAASAGDKLWSGSFTVPVPQDANSAFGTRSIFNGEPRNPHSGADFLSPAGTPVRAPNAGRVVLASNLYFSGNTVIIDHGLGLFSLFAHLSAIDVEPAARVTRGDVVGKVGATGRVTGAHLHWSVRANGARVDPLSLVYVTRDRFKVQGSVRDSAPAPFPLLRR